MHDAVQNIATQDMRMITAFGATPRSPRHQYDSSDILVIIFGPVQVSVILGLATWTALVKIMRPKCTHMARSVPDMRHTAQSHISR